MRGIVGTLEKLLDDFIDRCTKIEKEEMSSQHAHDLLMHAQEGSLVEVSALEFSNLIPGSTKNASDAFLQDPTGPEVKSPEASSRTAFSGCCRSCLTS